MPGHDSPRARKKHETRQRIAKCASAMFAERGYDAVSMAEVARAADVSEQTLYNYFPTKPELVLDRAEPIRELYSHAVRERGEANPAAALEPLVLADVERYRTCDLDVTRGEFVAQCVDNPALRRYALEERERQTHVIADSISTTVPGMAAVVAHAHAAALVAVIQAVHDQIGVSVLNRAPQQATAKRLRATVSLAFDQLGRAFAASSDPTTTNITPRPAKRAARRRPTGRSTS